MKFLFGNLLAGARLHHWKTFFFILWYEDEKLNALCRNAREEKMKSNKKEKQQQQQSFGLWKNGKSQLSQKDGSSLILFNNISADFTQINWIQKTLSSNISFYIRSFNT